MRKIVFSCEDREIVSFIENNIEDYVFVPEGYIEGDARVKKMWIRFKRDVIENVLDQVNDTSMIKEIEIYDEMGDRIEFVLVGDVEEREEWVWFEDKKMRTYEYMVPETTVFISVTNIDRGTYTVNWTDTTTTIDWWG